MPLENRQMGSQDLKITDQVSRGVRVDTRLGCRSSGTPLVVQNHPEMVRIKKPAVHRHRARTGAAMEKHHRHTVCATGFLPIHFVTVIECDATACAGLDIGEKGRTQC